MKRRRHGEGEGCLPTAGTVWSNQRLSQPVAASAAAGRVELKMDEPELQSKRGGGGVGKRLIEHISGVSSQMGAEDFRVVGTIGRRGRSGRMWVTLLSLGLFFFFIPPLTSHFISFN